MKNGVFDGRWSRTRQAGPIGIENRITWSKRRYFGVGY